MKEEEGEEEEECVTCSFDDDSWKAPVRVKRKQVATKWN